MGARLDQIWKQGDASWYDVSWTRDRRFGLLGETGYVEMEWD
jgi:hypothetical protein